MQGRDQGERTGLRTPKSDTQKAFKQRQSSNVHDMEFFKFQIYKDMNLYRVNCS